MKIFTNETHKYAWTCLVGLMHLQSFSPLSLTQFFFQVLVDVRTDPDLLVAYGMFSIRANLDA